MCFFYPTSGDDPFFGKYFRLGWSHHLQKPMTKWTENLKGLEDDLWFVLFCQAAGIFGCQGSGCGTPSKWPFFWLYINGGDPNHLQVLGWSSKYFYTRKCIHKRGCTWLKSGNINSGHKIYQNITKHILTSWSCKLTYQEPHQNKHKHPNTPNTPNTIPGDYNILRGLATEAPRLLNYHSVSQWSSDRDASRLTNPTSTWPPEDRWGFSPAWMSRYISYWKWQIWTIQSC